MLQHATGTGRPHYMSRSTTLFGCGDSSLQNIQSNNMRHPLHLQFISSG